MCRAVVSLVLALCMQTAAADALLRNLEIQQCSDAELATWGDGKDRMAASGALTFSYRHAGSPRWFQENQVLGLLQPAQVTLATPAAQSSRSNIIIQWDAQRRAVLYSQSGAAESLPGVPFLPAYCLRHSALPYPQPHSLNCIH